MEGAKVCGEGGGGETEGEVNLMLLDGLEFGDERVLLENNI
jgi:hypothetical protein